MESIYYQIAKVDAGFLAWHFHLLDQGGNEIASIDRAFRGIGREVCRIKTNAEDLHDHSRFLQTLVNVIWIWSSCVIYRSATGRYSVHFGPRESPGNPTLKNVHERELNLNERAVSVHL